MRIKVLAYSSWPTSTDTSLTSSLQVIFFSNGFDTFSFLCGPLLHLLLFITRKYEIICVKRWPVVQRYIHLRINQIQLRFLHFNQHSITLLGIHMRHWAYKREKYTFINANIKVINTILKVNRDNWHTLKCKHYSLTFLWHCLQFNSIPGQP